MKQASNFSSAPFTVLLGGTLIDGNGNVPLRDACVVIREDRIVEVGSRTEIQPPENAKVIDVTGKFIIPGLIDIHVHYHDWMGELFLTHGVTTVKDMGNDIEWISRISSEVEEGKVRGPRIVYVGNALDASPPAMEHHIGLDDHSLAVRAVELLHSRGASAIKVREKITPELLRIVTDKAHQLGLPVTGHLMRTDAREAALAGIDGLEHATGIVQAIAGRPRQAEPGENPVQRFILDFEAYSRLRLEKIEEVVEFLASHKVALIPTMADLSRLVREHGDDFAVEDAEYAGNPLLAYVPQGVRKMWATSYFFKLKDGDGLERAHSGYKKQQELLLLHYKAGGKVLAGTDTFFSVPGLTLQRELSVLVEAGFSPLQAISVATRDNAQFLGRGSELGTIMPGKAADIIVVTADPLDDIRNLRRLSLIMKDGQVIDPNYHADYSTPTPKPKLTRPLWLEQQLHGVSLS
jgi:imidazolonepropionase-like amidohydrolase